MNKVILLVAAAFAAAGCTVSPGVDGDGGAEDAGEMDPVVDGGASTCGECSGCCADGTCRVGSARAACGTGAALCQACTAFQACEPEGCRLSCDETTCPSGCCADGACVTGASAGACGGGGDACSTCASSAMCLGQECRRVLRVTLVYNYYPGGGSKLDAQCVTTRRMEPATLDEALAIFPTTNPDAGTRYCTLTDTGADAKQLHCFNDTWVLIAPGIGSVVASPPETTNNVCGWNRPNSYPAQ